MYAAGNALAVAIWLVIGLTLGHAFPTTHGGTDWFSVFLRLLMGLVMLALGTNLLLKGPRNSHASSHSASKHPDLRAFLIGMGLMAPNVSSLVLFFPALAAITRGAPTRAEEFLLIGLLVLITMGPCLIPLLLVGIAGRGGRALSSIASITGLNRSNGRWDCWFASPQPNPSSSAESWLLEQPGFAA
jgi:threonine/homoserine/homoserine lactone efflux protein